MIETDILGVAKIGSPVELTETEVDAVAGGAQPDQVGLVNAQNILNNNRTRILNDSINNNDVAVGVAVLALQGVRAG